MPPVEGLSGVDDIEDIGKNGEETTRLQNKVRIRMSSRAKKSGWSCEETGKFE